MSDLTEADLAQRMARALRERCDEYAGLGMSVLGADALVVDGIPRLPVSEIVKICAETALAATAGDAPATAQRQPFDRCRCGHTREEHVRAVGCTGGYEGVCADDCQSMRATAGGTQNG